MTQKILLKSRVGIPHYSHIVHYHLEKSAGMSIVSRFEQASEYIRYFGKGNFNFYPLFQQGLASLHNPQVVSKIDYQDYLAHRINTTLAGFYSFHGQDVIFPNPLFQRPLRQLSFTVLRDPISRFKSLVRYMFRRRMLTSRQDLHDRLNEQPHKFNDYATRYFLTGDASSLTLGDNHVYDAFSNLETVDWVIPQSNSSLINAALCGCLSTFQLPNVVSPQKINISDKSDLDAIDLSEDELNELAHINTKYDQHLFALAQPLMDKACQDFSFESFGDFNDSKLHPITCLINPTETVGGNFQSRHSFVETKSIL